MPPLRRRSGEPLTITDVFEAGRRMLRAGTPTDPREIRERMDALDAVMECMSGPHYATDFYVRLGQEWSRLSALLSGGSSRGTLAPATETRSTDSSRSQYAADE